MKSHRGIGAALGRWFAIDLRSLAAFRIGVGSILLVDLALRAGSLEAHYSDAGVLPRADFARLFLVSPWNWSIHELSGEPGVQALLFALAGVAALALVVGYRTRLATGISWLLLASLHARNPMLQYGADHLLRMLLLWSIFLPLGARWSIDARRRRMLTSNAHLSVASAAILIQLFLMYAFSGVFKLNDAWFEGHALQSSLSMDMFAKPLAGALLEHPAALDAATVVIPWLEIGCALLLFVPWATLRFRVAALVLLAGFHVSIEFLLETGAFQVLSLSALLLFVPGSWWERLASTPALHLFRARSGTEPSPAARDVLDEPAMGTFVHDISQTLAALLLIYVVLWNVCTLTTREYAREHSADWMSETEDGVFRYRMFLPGYAVERRLGRIGWVGRAAGLHQQWNMFEEGGGTLDGWHVVIGTLENGERISLLEGGRAYEGATHPKPECASALYASTRWRTCFKYMIEANRAHELLANVLAREWNRDHPELPIRELEILHVQEPALPGEDETPRRVTTWFRGAVPQTSRLRTDQTKPSYQ